MDGYAPTTRRRGFPIGTTARLRGRCLCGTDRSESRVPPKKLLIVEDSAAMRERIRAVADDVSGIRIVGEACDSDTAIELCERHEPDLLTLDLYLASGSRGIDVLRHVEQRARRPRIIVLSFDAEQLGSNRHRLPGVDDVLDKVMDFDSLKKILADSVKQLPG